MLLTLLPYLRRLTLPPKPGPHPISPSTPPAQHTLGSQPQPEPRGKDGE